MRGICEWVDPWGVDHEKKGKEGEHPALGALPLPHHPILHEGFKGEFRKKRFAYVFSHCFGRLFNSLRPKGGGCLARTKGEGIKKWKPRWKELEWKICKIVATTPCFIPWGWRDWQIEIGVEGI